MKSVLRFIHAAAAALLVGLAVPAQAAVVRLDGTFWVDYLGELGGLEGLVNAGDRVAVEAFYDPDLAVVREDQSPLAIYYDFPAAGAGVSVTVNDLTWRTAGPLTVGLVPVSFFQSHPDGTVAATYGGPQWLAYGSPRPDAALSAIESPFDASGGRATFLFYLPAFVTGLLPPDLALPTDLSTAQLAGPDFVHGAVGGSGPQGDYFFNFTSPVPEPATYVSMLAGLGLLGWVAARRRRRVPSAPDASRGRPCRDSGRTVRPGPHRGRR